LRSEIETLSVVIVLGTVTTNLRFLPALLISKFVLNTAFSHTTSVVLGLVVERLSSTGAAVSSAGKLS
jgi:hypothetical protein